jgi:hypothetical protein
MSDDFAVEPQPSEGDLPEGWREHVRELRQENARRRKTNQELRAQLARAEESVRAAEEAQAAAQTQAEREASRHQAVRRRLKELALARQVRAAVAEAAARTSRDGGESACEVDVARALRILERMPSPVNVETELTVNDDGQVALAPEADERLRGLVGDLVEMLTAERQVAPPPVGGEPPRPAESESGPLRNAWDPEEQASPSARARATLREAAAREGRVLDELVQM